MNKKLEELLKNPGPKIEGVIGDNDHKVEVFCMDVDKEEVETRESFEAKDKKDLQKSLRTFEKRKAHGFGDQAANHGPAASAAGGDG